ncbi:hypothetical protein RJ641_030639 [Dillenia turbinata]|uniref:BHLH domain-containing protein n=1 Tax=Dillenia turbinata TaxID=194707 RepID=A0AAN8VU57_9MAGN
MGASPPYSLLLSLDKGGCRSSGSLWSQILEARAKRRCQRRQTRRTGVNGGQLRSKRRGRNLTRRRTRTRRALQDGPRRRPINGIERRVGTLKKLVPNSESMGLDGLFQETADYILSLQMRVKIMQIMVKVLSDSDE